MVLRVLVLLSAFVLPLPVLAGLALGLDCPGPGCPSNSENIGAEEYQPFAPAEQVNIYIGFKIESASLSMSEKSKLDAICKVVGQFFSEDNESGIQIIGHSDSAGSPVQNVALSLQRAEAVRNYMIEECRIPDQRLLAIGVGDRYPLAERPNQANRRVEFQVITDFPKQEELKGIPVS